jgi:uncharacterized SAM-binding protein YcdF (DUF218 family)
MGVAEVKRWWRPRSRRLRTLRNLTVAFTLIGLTWLVGGYFVVVHPRVNTPTRADAVIVLGGVHNDGRLQIGIELAEQGLSDNLVLSVGASDVAAMNTYACGDFYPKVTVTCFVPSPATTQGEAQELRRLARQHGWKTVIVVTSTYHVSRARFIFDRCFDGRIEMVAAHKGGISLHTWAYQYLYQTAGYLKAFTHTGC